MREKRQSTEGGALQKKTCVQKNCRYFGKKLSCRILTNRMVYTKIVLQINAVFYSFRTSHMHILN